MKSSKLLIAVLGISIALPASAQLVRLGGNAAAGGQTGVNLGQTTGQLGGTLHTGLNGAADVDASGPLSQVEGTAAHTKDRAAQTTDATAKKTKKAAKHAKAKTDATVDQAASAAKTNAEAAGNAAGNTSVSAGASSDSSVSAGNASATSSHTSNVNADKSGISASTDASANVENPKKK